MEAEEAEEVIRGIANPQGTRSLDAIRGLAAEPSSNR